MCGIVGYVGREHRAVDVLIDGLRRLEYRGYDSAGVAIIEGEIYSCSQAGVFRGWGNSIELLYRPRFRVMAMEEWEDEMQCSDRVLILCHRDNIILVRLTH